jgi:hypothetical protein
MIQSQLVNLFTTTCNIKKILRSAHTVYLCFLYGSRNKQHLFLHAALTVWFLQLRRRVFTARYEVNLHTIRFVVKDLNISSC